jgi:nitrate reductase (NAD(P)H)
MCPFASLLLTADQQQQSLSCPVTGASFPKGPASYSSSSSSLATAFQQHSGSGMLTPSSSSDSLTEHLHLPSSHFAQSTVLQPSSEATQHMFSAAASNPSSSSSSSSGTHQAWQLKRPVLQHDPKLTRRQLRQLNRTWSLADVAQHRYCDDGWIAVDGKVYDITEHLVNHPGWDSGCQVTTVLSILAHLGTDCSVEFREIHRPYPVAWKQLQAYYVGELEQ